MTREPRPAAGTGQPRLPIRGRWEPDFWPEKAIRTGECLTARVRCGDSCRRPSRPDSANLRWASPTSRISESQCFAVLRPTHMAEKRSALTAGGRASVRACKARAAERMREPREIPGDAGCGVWRSRASRAPRVNPFITASPGFRPRFRTAADQRTRWRNGDAAWRRPGADERVRDRRVSPESVRELCFSVSAGQECSGIASNAGGHGHNERDGRHWTDERLGRFPSRPRPCSECRRRPPSPDPLSSTRRGRSRLPRSIPCAGRRTATNTRTERPLRIRSPTSRAAMSACDLVPRLPPHVVTTPPVADPTRMCTGRPSTTATGESRFKRLFRSGG